MCLDFCHEAGSGLSIKRYFCYDCGMYVPLCDDKQ